MIWFFERPGERLQCEIRRSLSNGYELVFFDMLSRRLQDLAETRATHFELLDLEPCVRHLCAKKIWGRDCDVLRSEIVAFVRERVEQPAIQRSAFGKWAEQRRAYFANLSLSRTCGLSGRDRSEALGTGCRAGRRWVSGHGANLQPR